MSYHKPEADTLHHRISVARTAFSRLQKWLIQKRGLAVNQRLQLWQTCVYSVLSYGLCTIGLTVFPHISVWGFCFSSLTPGSSFSSSSSVAPRLNRNYSQLTQLNSLNSLNLTHSTHSLNSLTHLTSLTQLTQQLTHSTHSLNSLNSTHSLTQLTYSTH